MADPPNGLFIDTSAIVALIAQEADADVLTVKIEEAPSCVTSPLVILEACMRLTTLLNVAPAQAERSIRKLLEAANVEIVELRDSTATLAVRAFGHYGKGRGHPARLNICDCFSHACARELGLSLLYKGNDFAHTDSA